MTPNHNTGQPDPNQRQRLLWAVALSAAVLIVFDGLSMMMFGRHVMSGVITPPMPKPAIEQVVAPVEESAGSGILVKLENPALQAEVALTGGRIEQVLLKRYAEKLGAEKGYQLFANDVAHAERIVSGWQGAGIEGPSANTPWQLEADVNGEGKPLVMVWRNGTGQSFQREIKPIADSYMMEITERVVNGAALPVTLTPFAQVERMGGSLPNEHSSWVNFLGPMGVVQGADGKMVTHQQGFDTLKKGQFIKQEGTGGWWGITSQYFMAAILPDAGVAGQSERELRHDVVAGKDRFTARVAWQPMVVQAGGSAALTYQVYMGPKQEAQLQRAGHELERAIEWGWFVMIAKPLYHVLVWLHAYLGNWGLAVIAITLLLKIVTFPLANKSYHAMARMKKLQPKIEKLKERLGDDQQAMAVEMMKIYREEKVNPLSGCWPMLIQIPIFFAMYKVVLVAFEFRHAPLALWVQDMSLPDPWFVLPVLMGVSMWAQFKLNPPPTDPTQAAVFAWMPAMMTVMFLWFPSGLVLYWLTNNVLSVAQQWWIMRADKAI
ncbi:MAG: membrane protein insertase YidC [Proteobacteria bacterium]|nr:membrane protein insertase YidC [Pseudomonadota bacterium]